MAIPLAIPLVLGGAAATGSGTGLGTAALGTAAVIGAGGLVGGQFFPNSTAGAPPGPATVRPSTGNGRPVVVSPPIPNALTFANAAVTPLAQQAAIAGGVPANQIPLFSQGVVQRAPQSTSSSVPRTPQSPQAPNQTTPTITVSKSNPPGPTSFVGQIPFFLNAILSTPAGALPKVPLWVVVFDFDTNIKNTIKKVKDYEPRMPEPWEIDDALDTVTTHRYQDEKGCMFAQAVTLPGEALIYTREGIQYNSFIRGGVGQGRQDFDSVRIGFLNTNVSFVDNVIRPWVVMTGHLGMIARPSSQKYRCNMTVYKLGIDKVDRPPFVAQQFNFWEVCPINVSSENLDYSGDGRTPIKEAEFVYQWYTTTSYKNRFAITNAEDIFAGLGRPEIRKATPN